jgi:dipeptidyl aminopeptidase/acylaminoacyl peptidase
MAGQGWNPTSDSLSAGLANISQQSKHDSTTSPLDNWGLVSHLIVHGTADILVPIQQSERYVSALKAAGRTVQLEVRPGKGHGWPGMESELGLFIGWFGKYLPAK